MKHLARNLVAGGFAAIGVLRLLRRLRRRSLVILCYHRVLPADARAAYFVPDLAVTPGAFAAQVALAARLYDCLPLHEAMNQLATDGPRSRPLLSFTFDDGYGDNHTHARPVLNDHGIRATFFLVTSLIGTQSLTWYDTLARAAQRLARSPSASLAKRPALDDAPGQWIAEHFRHHHGLNVSNVVHSAKSLSPAVRAVVVERVAAAAVESGPLDTAADRLMTPDEVRALAADGHEIGSHTGTHPILPQLHRDALTAELQESRETLAELTGKQPDSLAYPNGDFDDATVEAARRAGYRYAVTTIPGVNDAQTDPLRLRRVFISQNRLSRGNGTCSPSLLELELTGLADGLFLRRQRAALST